MSVPVWVGVMMGSDSDWSVVSAAVEVLDELGIGSEARVLSAHRTPHELLSHGEDAERLGSSVLIAADRC